MQQIDANINSTIVIDGLSSYNYYLFVFNPSSCNEYKEILAPNVDCASGVFTFNIDLPMQVYTVYIYGQSSNINTNILLAEYIRTETIRVYNPVDMCYSMPFILDENGYIISNESNINLLYR